MNYCINIKCCLWSTLKEYGNGIQWKPFWPSQQKTPIKHVSNKIDKRLRHFVICRFLFWKVQQPKRPWQKKWPFYQAANVWVKTASNQPRKRRANCRLHIRVHGLAIWQNKTEKSTYQRNRTLWLNWLCFRAYQRAGLERPHVIRRWCKFP